MSPEVFDGVVDIPIMGHPSGGPANASSSSPATDLLRGFFVGPENRLIEVAVESVLDGRAARYSPIVFYGPSGVGKSHLAIGLATAWKASFPRRPVIFTTAIDFARQLADAMETKTVDDFGARYRQASLLVLEDVHHLRDKPAAEEELIHTLDALLDSGGKVVVTSRTAPHVLADFPPRLRSRLTAGLTVPVVAPGPAVRRTVLDRLAQAQGMDLAETVVRALAEQAVATVPELRGILAQLRMTAELEHRPVDLPMVNEQLAEQTRRKAPTIDQIAKAAARHFSLKLSDLRSSSRARAVVVARGVAMYLARTLTPSSLEQIGRYFGGRDHTTVSHGCRRTEKILQSEPAVRQAVLELRERLHDP
jgi:chromosomal replication initiator protein